MPPLTHEQVRFLNCRAGNVARMVRPIVERMKLQGFRRETEAYRVYERMLAEAEAACKVTKKLLDDERDLISRYRRKNAAGVRTRIDLEDRYELGF